MDSQCKRCHRHRVGRNNVVVIREKKSHLKTRKTKAVQLIATTTVESTAASTKAVILTAVPAPVSRQATNQTKTDFYYRSYNKPHKPDHQFPQPSYYWRRTTITGGVVAHNRGEN